MSSARQLIETILRLLCALITLLSLAPGIAVSAGPQSGDKPLVHMGGSSVVWRTIPRKDAEIAFNAVLEELMASSPLRLRVTIYPSIQDVAAAMDKNEINGFFGTPLEYTHFADRLGEEIMATRFENLPLQQQVLLLTRKGDAGKPLAQMRNKRLALSRFQDIEELFLNTLLLRQGLPEIAGFFAQRSEPKNPNVAIMDVYFGKADLTIVSERDFQTAVELNPQIGNELVIQHKSPPVLQYIGGVSKTIDRKKLRELMRILQENSGRGRRLASVIPEQLIVEITRNDLNSIFELKSEYETLKRNAAAKTKSQRQR